MDSLSIDGSILKGGGQVVRNSISLSALLGKPVSIQNIRLDRNPPGLKNQHRTGAFCIITITILGFLLIVLKDWNLLLKYHLHG